MHICCSTYIISPYLKCQNSYSVIFLLPSSHAMLCWELGMTVLCIKNISWVEYNLLLTFNVYGVGAEAKLTANDQFILSFYIFRSNKCPFKKFFLTNFSCLSLFVSNSNNTKYVAKISSNNWDLLSVWLVQKKLSQKTRIRKTEAKWNWSQTRCLKIIVLFS